MFDNFDLYPQCDEVYNDNNLNLRILCDFDPYLEPDDIDWTDANVEGVTVDGIPLDGHYLEHLLDENFS